VSGSVGGSESSGGEAWEDLARRAAASPGEQDAPELLRELLAFWLTDAPYAIPVERVREIVRLRPITPMPHVPPEVLGVIALRGEIVEVVDLRMRLGLTATNPDRHSRIIVLHGDDNRVTGILVDRVREVLRVDEEEISLASGEGTYVSELCRCEEEFVSIVDVDRMLEIRAE